MTVILLFLINPNIRLSDLSGDVNQPEVWLPKCITTSWLVSFMDYDLGYFDLETRVLEPEAAGATIGSRAGSRMRSMVF